MPLARHFFYSLAPCHTLVTALIDAISGMHFLWRSKIGTDYAKWSSVVITCPLTTVLFKEIFVDYSVLKTHWD